jgi:hypothetical protein
MFVLLILKLAEPPFLSSPQHRTRTRADRAREMRPQATIVAVLLLAMPAVSQECKQSFTTYDCSNLGLRALPPNIPGNTTVL